MVNLVDAFTKTHGRAPTMKELDTMHELKKDQEKLKALKDRVDQAKLDKILPKKNQNRRRHPVPLRMPRNAKIVNRMMLREMPINDIAFALDLPESAVKTFIRDWDLPRRI